MPSGTPAPDVVLIATPLKTGEAVAQQGTSPGIWKIGTEVYRAPVASNFDNQGQPIGKRWEATFEQFKLKWDSVYAQWFEKTEAWTDELDLNEEQFWKIITESVRTYTQG